MIDKNCVNVVERLRPMAYDALERLSFGLAIVSREIVFVPQVQTEKGPRPGFGLYYQARGVLLGTDNYFAQITVFLDPFISQEGIDEAIQDGCTQLREIVAAQRVLGDGKTL
jgi:hypothetical protein